MNRLLLATFLAGLVLAAAAVAGVAQPHLASGAADSSARTITATGDGTVTTVPDHASFQFGVTTQETDAQDALSRNAAAANAVVAALRSAGVADSDLQTTEVSLSPVTDPGGTRIVAYTASNTVSARVALARAGALVDTAVAAGADTVEGPLLDSSDQSALYDQALGKAVTNARDKARALAQAGGVTLGPIQSIAESGSSVPLPYGAGFAAAASPSTPVEPGTQEVDASATVTYAVTG